MTTMFVNKKHRYISFMEIKNLIYFLFIFYFILIKLTTKQVGIQ